MVAGLDARDSGAASVRRTHVVKGTDWQTRGLPRKDADEGLNAK